MSTLTAIVCNYNHGRFIQRAIEALLNQERPADQLIIVDDASTDDSVRVIESCAAKSPAIHFLRNEENLGWHASTAKALTVATGDYLYSGAADDYVLPGFFEAVCGLMDRYPAAGIGCAQMVTASPDGQPLRTEGYSNWRDSRYVSAEEFLRQGLEAEPPTHSLSAATIYRRERVLKIGGFRSELGPWSDTFALRAVGLESGMCYVAQPGMVWVRAPLGMSQSAMRDPSRSLRMLRQAAGLMRSPEFRTVFPPDYVDRWEQAYWDTLVLRPLQPSMEAYQTIQQCCRETAAQARWPMRCLLGISRRCMTACYLATHWLQRIAIRRTLRQLEPPSNSGERR